MGRLARCAALAALASVAAAAAGGAASVRVVGVPQQLTALSFDEAVAKGPLFVEVFAPWCKHCKALEGTWTALAVELAPDNVAVATVNGVEERALAQRLHVEVFPTLVLLRDGKAWEYTGGRGLNQLAHFARAGFKSTPAMPWHKAPNSLPGRVTGWAYAIPHHAEKAFREAKAAGWSDVALLCVGLAILLVGALAFVIALDAVFTPLGVGPAPQADERPHAE